MLQNIGKTQNVVFMIVADVRRGGGAVVVVDGGERDGREVGRRARVRAARAAAVRHFHEPPH